jgi:hypothetical protein
MADFFQKELEIFSHHTWDIARLASAASSAVCVAHQKNKILRNPKTSIEMVSAGDSAPEISQPSCKKALSVRAGPCEKRL